MSEAKLMKHLELQGLISRLHKLCNDSVLDIIIFGSITKGKEKPNDIDIAIVLKEEEYKLADALSAKIKEAVAPLKVQIELLLMDKIFDEPLFLTLMHEGVSCKHKKSVASVLKTRSIVLVTYNLTNLDKSQKTMFGYALRGRTKGTGLLGELGGEPVGRNGFILPIENIEKVKEMLDLWKVKYDLRRLISVPSYLR